MNTTATTKIALAALAAPMLAGLAIGLASTATASGVPSAQDTITQLKNQGFRVVVNVANKTTTLDECSVISTRQDHRIHGASHGDISAYVDVICPPATPAPAAK